MTELCGYVLETLRKGGEFILYRGRQRGDPVPVLVLTPVAEQPTPASLRRLEHEYSLAAELDPAWAARPLALTRHDGRTILVLKDPGGEPMDRILDRGQGQPLELTLRRMRWLVAFALRALTARDRLRDIAGNVSRLTPLRTRPRRHPRAL
jgi:hypothetical protein